MATRSVVKHSYIKQSRSGQGRAKAHVRYVAYRPGKTKHPARTFFDEREDAIAPKKVLAEIGSIRTAGVLIHKLILSPGVDSVDTREYTRYVLKALAERKAYCFNYRAVIHDNTAHEHAHVIIFGRDRDNWPVRLSKDDYAFMRERGDRFVEKTIERELETPPPETTPANPVERFLNLLTGTFGKFTEICKDFGDSFVGRGAPVNAPQQYKYNDEQSIGNLWSAEEKLAAWRMQKQKESRAEEYAKQPIEITIATNVQRCFGQNSSKEDLVGLKQSFDSGYYADQVTPRDVAKLDSWINQWEQWEIHCRQVEKRLYAKSFDVQFIELPTISGESAWFSDKSDLTDLQGVMELHEKCVILLRPDEAKALERWIREKQLSEPIVIDLGDGRFPLIYDQKDSLESLTLLARTCRDALEPESVAATAPLK